MGRNPKNLPCLFYLFQTIVYLVLSVNHSPLFGYPVRSLPTKYISALCSLAHVHHAQEIYISYHVACLLNFISVCKGQTSGCLTCHSYILEWVLQQHIAAIKLLTQDLGGQLYFTFYISEPHCFHYSEIIHFICN